MNDGAPEDSDMLRNMFKQQRHFMRRLQEVLDFPNFPLDMSKKKSFAFLRDVGTRSVEEIFEALQHLKAGKPWRSDQDSWDRAAFVEEFVDAQRFLLEVLILLGVTPDEFFTAFEHKVQVTHARLDKEEASAPHACSSTIPSAAEWCDDCKIAARAALLSNCGKCGMLGCEMCFPTWSKLSSAYKSN